MPGIGAKTSSQIILDLKGKLVEVEEKSTGVNAQLKDALEALKTLGYKQSELKGITKKLQEEDLTTDAYIRKALTLLAK